MVDEKGEISKEQLMDGSALPSRRFRLCPMGKGKPLKRSQSKWADSQIFFL